MGVADAHKTEGADPFSRGMTRIAGLRLASMTLLLALVAGCSGGGPPATTTATNPPPASAIVHIADFKFGDGGPVHIRIGGTVTWHNGDATIHTATADSGPVPDTGDIAAGSASTPQTFGAAGTFGYHCTKHPTMHATVVVS